MRSFHQLVLTLALSVLALPAAAQTGASEITGLVLDPTPSGVPGAVVVAECAGKRTEAITNGEGRYSLRVASGPCRLRVRKDGFAPIALEVSVPAGESLQQDFQFDLAGIADAITVTAGGFEQIVRDAPASVTVIQQEQLRERRVSDLAQALIDVEGVDVGQNVGKTGGLTISVRGMPSDYTLMLIDGRRQNSPGSVTPNGFGETATSFMPPVAAIERIEVVRGPMSTLYGSDAMGGVVNVITRKVSERWTGSATVSGTLQSNSDYGNTAQGDLYLAGPIIAERLGLALRGSAFHRQAAALKYENLAGTQVPITSFGLSPTRADNQNVGARLSYSLNQNHDLFFDIDGMSQAYDNSNRQLGTVGLQGGYAEEMKFRRQQFSLTHAGRIGGSLLDTSFTRNTTDTLGRTIPPGTPGRTPGDPRSLEATNTLLDSKLVSHIRGTHMLSVGGQWWDAHMVDGVAPEAFNFSQSAVFIEDEWRLLPKLALTGGIRYDHHTTFGGNPSPRAYLVYNALPGLTLKGGVSRGFKTPQLNQLATGIVGFGGQGTIPLIGSPGLTPETSTSTEAGAAWTVKGISLNVMLFNNQFNNKIAQGPGLENCSFALSPNRPGCVDFGNWPNVDLFGQSINVDEALTRGVESALRIRLFRRVDVLNNYTFTESEQRSGAQTGQPLVNTPKHMFNSTIRYRTSRRLNTWLRIEARSSRTRGTSATARAATQQIGPFQGYGMAHLGVGYEVSRNVMLNATVYNLLNTDFLAYRAYTYNNATVYGSVYNNLQEPRRLWLSLTYQF